MSSILVALSNLFSSQKSGTKGEQTPLVTCPAKEQTKAAHDPPKATLHGGTTTKLKGATTENELPKPRQATANLTNSQSRFPLKLFNIDIDSEFPPDKAEGEPLLPKKSVSEASFLNDYIEPDDVDFKDANGNTILSDDDDSPEIKEIIQLGIRDFQAKYLQKIDAAFQVQLEHVTTIFRNGLEKAYATIENQLNQEMTTIRSDYRNRIVEFEASTTYYQNATTDIIEENRIQGEEMATKIQDLKNRIQETSETLKIEMERKIEAVEQKLREDRSKVKLEFHEKVCEAGNIVANGRYVLEEKFKHEVKKQEEMIAVMRMENDELEEKIDIAEIHAMAEFNRRENIKFMRERDHHDDLVRKRALEKKLEILQKQNADLIASHKLQIMQMNELHDIRTEHYNSEFRYFKTLLAETRSTFEEDINHFKESSKLQEEAHEAALESLHDAYREKIMGLLDSVQELKDATDFLYGRRDPYKRPELKKESLQAILSEMGTPSELKIQLQQLRSEVSSDCFSVYGNSSPN